MKGPVSSRKITGKKSLAIAIVFISVFVVYYSIMSMFAPVRKLAELQRETGNANPSGNEIYGSILTDSVYIKLIARRAFLLSRIAMAETDSNYLSVNLTDSTVFIEISGVVVHRSRISSIKISKLLKGAIYTQIQPLLSSPFKIVKDYSTIQKEPVMIKIAPKDSSEYKPDIIPDTSLSAPANCIFELNNGIHLIIYEEKVEKFHDRLVLLRFDVMYRLRITLDYLESIVRFKVPDYHPSIKISLPRSAIKIIYRAIPGHGKIGIYI